MRKQLTISFALMLLCLGTANGKPRTQNQIIEVAKNLFLSNTTGRHLSKSTLGEPSVVMQDDALALVGYEGGGYAIVATDDLIPDVLGYSATITSLTTDNTSFQWWWRNASEAVKDIVSQGKPYRPASPLSYGASAEVPQMLTTAWGQTEPYNNQCPLAYDRSGNVIGRTLVGCVATAACQIMNYHRYPTQPTGTYTDVQTPDAWGNPLPIKINLNDYTFDYALMQDTYTPGSYQQDEAEEVAKLCYSAGVTFAMIYGVDASGTYLDSAAVGLKKHFGYANVRYMARGAYSEQTWMSQIYTELSNNRPIAYGGADNIFTIGGGGHCFVFDGYDERGLIHVNWGWNGKNDGYYDIALLNPGIHSFVNQQDMIVGIMPPETEGESSLSLSGSLSPNDFDTMVARSISDGLRHLDLSAAQLPDGILPEKAFYGSDLQTIILPQNVQTISDAAFGNCRKLTSVIFPENNGSQEFLVDDDIIYTIDGKEIIEVLPYYSNTDKVLSGYQSMLHVNEEVTALHPYALDGCFRIKGVEIPASVQTIGSHAFDHATSLKAVISRSVTPSHAALNTFSALNPGYTMLVVPAGTSDVYRRHSEWSHFFTLDNVSETGTNIRARNIVRYEGEKNPELRYQMFGEYVLGEPILHCEADETSPAGDYPIIVEKGTLQGDDIFFTNGVMRIVGTDGIVDINDDSDDGIVYDLQGRRCLPSHGVYIIKGKKQLIKY